MNNSEESLIQYMPVKPEVPTKVKVSPLNGPVEAVEEINKIHKACSVEINHKIKEMIYTVESPNLIF